MQNPLRSEAQMFRLVVIIGAGCAAVIAVALLTEPIYGSVLFLALVAIGLWKALTSAPEQPRPPETVVEGRAQPPDAQPRLLVVANETVGGGELLSEIE